MRHRRQDVGEVAGAVVDAEQSVTYADRSGDAGQRMLRRTTVADALHQAGRRAEAETRFREAEQKAQHVKAIRVPDKGRRRRDRTPGEQDHAACRDAGQSG